MKRIEKVYADYKHECENCGTRPVVSLTGLCGPCTFGEAACADPAEWEGEYEFNDHRRATGQAKGGGGVLNDAELERERAEVYEYVRRASAEFRRSMPERCFRHDHDFVNNRCKNCGFILIAEQAAGGSAAGK